MAKTASKTGKAKKGTTKKISAREVRVKRSQLSFVNPKNGNIVGYLRAIQLKLVTKKNVESGILNPKTGKLVSIETAIRQRLVS